MPITRSSRSKLQQSKLAFEPALSEDSSPPRRQARYIHGTSAKSRLTTQWDKHQDDEPVPLVSSQVNPNQSSMDYSFGEAETSGDEGIFIAPHKTQTSSKKKKYDFVIPDDEVEESEQSDEVLLEHKPTRVLEKPSNDIKVSRRRILDSDSESDNTDKLPRGTKRKRNQPRIVSVPSGSDKQSTKESTDEESDAPVRRQRSLKTSPKTEQDELLEELEELQDSPPVDSGSKNREAAAKRRETLEKMRKTRFGEASDSGPDEMGESEELSLMGAPDYLADENGDDSDDFIEYDDEPQAKLPLQFSHDAAASAKDMFQDMLHWMTHLILRDTVLEDEIYRLAHNKIQREFGQWGESFVSSAWRPEFINVLVARPEIHTGTLHDDRIGDQCQGCNRADTYSKVEVWFSGNPYDPDNLSDIDQVPGEPLVDRNGKELLDQRFVLGKTCFANATVAHPLEHWKYRLKKLLMEDYLDEELVPRKVTNRKRWSESKRIVHTDEVARNLVENHSAELWSRLKQSISHAWGIRSKN